MPISISINAGPTAQSSTVVASGTDQHIITSDERTAFGIQDAALKTAIAAYFGKAPDDAYVCSPTPWNDLYSTYKWPQVQATLSVKSATILGVSGDPTILNQAELVNNSSIAGQYNTGISQQVTVATQSTWSTTSTIEVGQKISYDIGFLGAGAQGETSFSFSQAWGQGGSESESITLGTSAGVMVTLQPGQSVEAELQATKGVLQVQIVYQLTLAGSVAVNYSDPYNGHHFWALDINGVMAADAIPLTVETTEVLSIDFYANTKVVLSDSSFAPLVLGARPGA